MPLPTLYSFRRCPYAMRARLGILLSSQAVNLREIILKHKPEPMLAASPKGTVPVLILSDGTVIDESLEIMCWALMQHDPSNLLIADNRQHQENAMALIQHNDSEFKPWLDKYKYADRNPERTQAQYRQQGECFLAQLDSILSKTGHLIGDAPSIADYAIFPFIRQFAAVDTPWFNQAPYPNVQRWLNRYVTHQDFISIMHKFPCWLDSEQEFIFGQRLG